MTDKTLLFKPQHQSKLRYNPFCAMTIFSKTIALCSQYLLESRKQKHSDASTNEYVKKFWRINFEHSFTSLYVTGREHIVPNETYIFMSNHESWMDIPAIFAAVPSSLRMVSKAGLMKMPIFGHAMADAGFIAIDRKNRQLAIRQLDEAKKRLAEGISVWLAPEGTRTRDGTIGPFKKGGFYLSRQLGKAIMPVFIEGAKEVMAADSFIVMPNRSITVHFLEPVTTKDLEHLDLNELVSMVRGRILAKQQEVLQGGKDGSSR